MPRLTRVGVRLSLLYLVISTLMGALVLQTKALGLPTWGWILWPYHVELMMVGFMLQFPMSIAYWILPKFGSRREREVLASTAIVLLNGGLLLQVFGLSGGRILEVLAVAVFLLHGWRRIKPPAPFPTPS